MLSVFCFFKVSILQLFVCHYVNIMTPEFYLWIITLRAVLPLTSLFNKLNKVIIYV